MRETSYTSLDTKLRLANENRSYAIAYLGILFFILLMILDCFRFQQGIIQSDINFQILAFIHFSFILYIIPILNKNFKFLRFKSSKLPLNTNAIVTIIILHITQIPLALMGAVTRNEMVSLAVYICVTNLIFESELKHKLYNNIIVLLIMVISVMSSTDDLTTRIAWIIQVLAIMCPCYILAKHQYSNRMKSHEDEVLLHQQNQLLKEKNEIIKSKNEELTSFAYASSHDLKAPLRTVGNFTQLLKRHLSNELDERGTEYMDYITSGVGNMSEMLDGLLDYATLDNQIKNEEKVNLNDVFLIVFNNLNGIISDYDASIEIKNDLPNIRMSKVLAIQLFQNLVSNAIKFKTDGQSPIISIEYTQPSNYHIISVIDNGCGIPKIYQEKIFNIFNRIHKNCKVDGYGIGLATCKKIVENYQGSISVESKEGEGSTFNISLPVNA